jgi:hypothetical protein
MQQALPQDSQIKIGTLNGYEHISMPYQNTGIIRFFIAGFILFWLGGWFVGFSSALGEIVSGKGSFFLIFWLGAWSLGGIFAVYLLYCLFRKPVPQQLLFNKPNLSLDTGTAPFNARFHVPHKQRKPWESLCSKRKRVEFSPEELKSLKLRNTEHGNRLTIDKGNERFEIASQATEIEKEWLFNYLQAAYSNVLKP